MSRPDMTGATEASATKALELVLGCMARGMTSDRARMSGITYLENEKVSRPVVESCMDTVMAAAKWTHEQEAMTRGIVAMDAAQKRNDNSYLAAKAAIEHYLACNGWNLQQVHEAIVTLCHRAALHPREFEPGYVKGGEIR